MEVPHPAQPGPGADGVTIGEGPPALVTNKDLSVAGVFGASAFSHLQGCNGEIGLLRKMFRRLADQPCDRHRLRFQQIDNMVSGRFSVKI